MAPRESWTDERLDDLARGVGEVRIELREVRVEIGQVREALGELRAEIKGLEKKFDVKFAAQQQHMDARFDDLTRTLHIGFGLIGAVLAGMLGLIAALLAAQL